MITLSKSQSRRVIKALRKRHGLTQQELADSLYGVTRSAIRAYEGSTRHCSPITLWAMVLTWDKMDLWSQEAEWKAKYMSKGGQI